MSEVTLVCQDDERRAQLRQKNSEQPTWNGIDYVDVISNDTILVHFLCEPSRKLTKNDFTITDQDGCEDIRIVDICFKEFPQVHLLLNRPATNSTYTLTIKDVDGIDPRFASHEFYFGTSAFTEVDPKPQPDCPPVAPESPEINYLARDYQSFRQLILDRLKLIMPEWQERHIPDLGMTLVELLSYVGDNLSYYQDAVATEAYLDTARHRASVRRHVRLVDYQLHEGCNARAFVFVEVSTHLKIDPKDIYFITKLDDARLDKEVVLLPENLKRQPRNSYEAYEPLVEKESCPHLKCDDIKNPISLFGSLASGDSVLAKLIFGNCSTQLQRDLTDFAFNAVSAPSTRFLIKLLNVLNEMIDQHCFWSECNLTKILEKETVDCLVSKHGEQNREPECNRAILEAAMPDIFSRPTGVDDSIRLDPLLNEIHFYTWDAKECCIDKGATSATLEDEWLDEDSESTVSDEDPCNAFVRKHQRKRKLGSLSPGDVLLLEEVVGPKTHVEPDANPAHRQAVRLTKVCFDVDPVHDQPIAEIAWDEADRLKFPLCISSVGPAPDCKVKSRLSIARGNIILVDHGLTIDQPEELGTTQPVPVSATCDDTFCTPPLESPMARRDQFRPTLDNNGLTFSQPLGHCKPAATILDQDVHQAEPAIWITALPGRRSQSNTAHKTNGKPVAFKTIFDFRDSIDPRRIFERLPSLTAAELRVLHDLVSPASSTFISEVVRQENFDQLHQHYVDEGAESRFQQRIDRFVSDIKNAVSWLPKNHLLDSREDDQHFVVEMDNNRRANLRFGNDDLGSRPPANAKFLAKYRLGNGTAGNVGADKITHLVFRRGVRSGIVKVRNPLAAIGGSDPESSQHAREHAPHAFRQLKRAITADDYAKIVRDEFPHQIQGARAAFHSTGSWTIVSVAIDPLTPVRDVDELLEDVRAKLNRYRRAGHHVNVKLPNFIPLDIAITVCVDAGHLRAHVHRELLQVLGSDDLDGGKMGFFHPDRLSFGDSIYMSELIAFAKKIPGVENITVSRFQRFGKGDNGEREAGVMKFGPLEIPRLNNDANRPECGRLCLEMRGER